MTKADATGPITAAELQTYVESRSDFAFELEIAQCCRGLRMDAYHGGIYNDPVTNKARQFDVRAIARRGGHFVFMAIECKCLAPEAPLLVLATPRQGREGLYTVLRANAAASDYRPYVQLDQYTGDQSYFPPHDAVGKAISQVTRKNGVVSGSEELYDKWMQAVASAKGLVADAATFMDTHRPDVKRVTVLPILAVSDETLWQVNYTAAGKREGEPHLVAEATYFIDQSVRLEAWRLDFALTHLVIMTKGRLREFLVMLERGSLPWENLFPPTPAA